MGDGPTLLLPATCGFARSDPEVCSGYQQAPFDPSPLDHVSYCCPAPRSPTLTKIIHPTRLNGWCRLMCGLRSLLPAKKQPNSSSNTPSSTRISSPPKCAWLWKHVSGCQRISAVCSPACSCKGLTVSPGTRPGSHRIDAVSSRSTAVSSVANARRVINSTHPVSLCKDTSDPGGLRR